MKSLVTRAAFCVLILTTAIPGLPLLAQETKPPAPAEKKAEDDKKPKVTEEMVVTARKREETVQEVPISVAAPTESQLRDRGAESLEDVSVNVAGFTVQNLGPGQSQVAMRGVSAGQIVRDQPGVKEQVGVYLDESVISLSLFTPDIDLFDMSRIEVLRGPQGTLFGSGSLSGTVRYISNQPKLAVSETVGEFAASSISGGSAGGNIKVAVNAPLSPTAAMRFAGYFTRYGGFIDAVQPNLSLKKDVNSGNRSGARLAFLFKPNENLSITPRILYQKIDMDGWNRVDEFNILANPYTTTRPKVTLGNHNQFTQLKEPFTDKFMLGDVNISYNLGGGKTLTSITSYSDRDVLVVRDATALTASITGGSIGLPANVYTLNAPLFDATGAKGFTQELRLSGGAPHLQWVTGAFYSGTKRDYSQNLPVTGFTALSGIPTAGTKLAKTDELYKSDLHYDFKQTAVFGELNYAVSDRLDLTGGLRWYNFKEDRTQVFDGIFSDPIDSVGSTSAHGFAPRGIASFKLTDKTRLNAQISKGFRLGGINDPLLVPNCQPQDLITYSGHPTWDDESLWNYEVGAKSSVMEGKGTFNAAAYYMDITNLQATLTAGTCSSRIILNVPKARTTGIESEFEVAPNDNFDFAVSGSYNKSELRSTVTAADAKGVQQVVPGLQSGNRLPTVPEFQMTAAATYRRPVGGSVGYLTGVYQHVGDRYTQIGDQGPGFGTVVLNAFNGDIGGPYTQPTFTFNPKLPAYDIVNLRVGILINKWDTALFVNNVTNETAFLALDQERGSRARVGYLTNQPRTIGISTRVNF
ncbi:MAG: iron complex outerrane recepter protein [Thermoanaerobaculia bacterium]|jgi:iron complex outermembrane receptor protein|nr:iron complex outerrane recepter protein [Thermoanaerobaculia bacterium]